MRVAVVVAAMLFCMAGCSQKEIQKIKKEVDAFSRRLVPVKLPSNTNSIGMEFIEIPAGKFTMGSPKGETGRVEYQESQVSVTLTQSFGLGKYEVTQGQWKSVMGTEPWLDRSGESGTINDAGEIFENKVFFHYKNVQIGEDNAATYVTWDKATLFCKLLTRIERNAGTLNADETHCLPTQAQWEYACRAGTKTAFSFGNDESKLGEYAWFATNAKDSREQYAHKVGLKKPNLWGLHDMHGNVWEWCSDWDDRKLPGGTDPLGPDRGSDRVYCGGGWENYSDECRSAHRHGNIIGGTDLDNDQGFRVARCRQGTQAKPAPPVAIETRPEMKKPEPVEKESVESVTNSIGMELIKIPAGTFMMGDGAGVAVTLTKPFELGKYEVTQGEFKKVMGKAPYSGGVDIVEDNPATYVNCDDAIEFCKKLTATERNAGILKADEEYRLPTQAQWEYACRAGTTTAFSFGDDEKQLGEYAWFTGNTGSKKYAHKVGAKKPNPWGLHDMHGNVWEWCSDWYYEELSGGTDPVGPRRGSSRVIRGGGWRGSPGYCRSASRGSSAPSGSSDGMGFRVARSQSVQ